MEAIPPSDIDRSEAGVNRPKRRADALTLMAESFLHPGATNARTADRYQVVVHVDTETLRASTAGRCEIEHGPSVAAETARRVACDASLITVTENARGEPLDVGRKTRSIPPAIRRALASRDRGCRFPGCTHQRYVDGHHIQHWVHGGETKLDNLVTLCRFHHRYVHDENVTVRAQPDGHWLFLKPDGTAFDDVRSTKTADYAWTDLLDAHDEQGIYIDSDTAATRWCGERMDYGLAIQGLLQLSERARRAGPATDTGPTGNAHSAQNPDTEQNRTCRQNVSAETSGAGTSEAEQDPKHDAQWRRHDEEGTFYPFFGGIIG
jgi:hypothetical protein